MAKDSKEEIKALNYAVYQSNIFVAKEGSSVGELKLPHGLVVDVTNQNVVIADSANARVQIFNHEGNLVSILGESFFKCPWGVAVNRTHIYVTDVYLHTIFRFRKSDLTLISATGTKGNLEEEFNFPAQPTLSHNGFLYIPDRYNNRIQILNPEFVFIKQVKNKVFSEPVDIKVTVSTVYVLCCPEKPAIHILKEEVVQTIDFPTVLSAFFFCIDPYRNFVVSDFHGGFVKIFKESNLLFKLGEGKVKENGEGELFHPCGVGFSGGKIVSVSHNAKFGLQIFSPPPYPRFLPD